MTNDNIVRVWTDGACIGNPGPGGWAFLKMFGGKTITRSGHICARTTNIEMEMVAVIQALRSLKRLDLAVIVHTDLKMIVQGVHEWMLGWIAKGWRKGDGKPVANQHLWEAINALCDARAPGAEITFVWVKGHAGCAENEQADRLAEAAARRAEALVGGGCDMPSRFDASLGLIVPVFDVEAA